MGGENTSRERILFVTGRLAEFSLNRVLDRLDAERNFDFQVCVLGISVAALMHVDWLRRRFHFPEQSGHFDRVVLPGWCLGDLSQLNQQFQTRFERGPKDLFDLPAFLGEPNPDPPDLQDFDIEILAEINHAPHMGDAQILAIAEEYRQAGANIIDLGCVPGESWGRAGEVTHLLRQSGFRVSIDSFDRVEVENAVAHGAELVLSCNKTNREWAADLDAELVVIPDTPDQLHSIEPTLDFLTGRGCRFRIDPILEPIAHGFTASLGRYIEARNRWPQISMMMGVGNLSEMTEVDSAGVNLLLTAICQELSIHSVLTTQVINWSRTAVAELDAARRLIAHCVRNRVLPKHLDSQLVMLRDPLIHELDESSLQELARNIRDPNFRILICDGEIHVMNRDGHWQSR
ncbi:MAG: DUF6513 domain-containing protein, partial [Planctomycetaceae bacterium]